jgi:sigma-B regulation protein RsbU (phosphoserine phosphatase)
MPSADDDVRSELFEGAPCGLLSTLENGTVCHVNRTFCTWLGYSATELIERMRLQDLLTMGCKIFHQTHWFPLLQMQGSVAEVQLELVHRDGHTLPVLVNAVRGTHKGAVRHDLAVFVASDRRKYERELLKARRQAEELLANVRSAQVALDLAQARLRLALDSADLLVWDVETARAAPRYEAGVQRLLGLPETAVVGASDFLERIHPEDRASEEAAFSAALRPSGDGTYVAEYRLRGHDGNVRAIVSRGRAFFAPDGSLSGFHGVLQDVTTWRRAEAVLREQEQQAHGRAVLAEQLVGIVSHDLRTPLHAVALGASLLASSDLAPAQLRTVGRIQSATTRASGLISDLLDFTQARLGSGLRVEKQPLELHALVAEVTEELKLAWPGRMIEHRVHGDGNGLGDPARLAQVVTNLANNALTYGAPDQPITITSTTGVREMSLQVHNRGAPIPAEIVSHIFEPLRRGEQQVKLGARNVGLGLYIVQEIATSHGGTVSVRSTAEEGTTFSVELPTTTR